MLRSAVGYPLRVLEYSLTEADLAAFAAFRAQQSGEEAQRIERIRLIAPWVSGTIAYLVVSLVIVIPLVLGREFAWAGMGELLAIGTLAAVGIWQSRHLAPVIARFLPRPYLAKARQALAQTGAERKLWLDADGLHVAVDHRAEVIPVSAVEKVITTDQHVFIFTGPTTAHVVPRRLGAPLEALVAQLETPLPPDLSESHGAITP